MKANREETKLWILSDSTTAIQTVINLSHGAKPRSNIERHISTVVRSRNNKGYETWISWIRSHIDIPGNELADAKAAEVSDNRGRHAEIVSGEGLKAWITQKRREGNNREGWGTYKPLAC